MIATQTTKWLDRREDVDPTNRNEPIEVTIQSRTHTRQTTNSGAGVTVVQSWELKSVLANRYRFSVDPEEYFRGFALPILIDSFSFCATIGAVALLLPHDPQVRVTAGWVLIAISYSGATLLFLTKRWIPMRLRQVVALPAVIAILGAVWVGGPGVGGVSLGSFMNLVAVAILAAFELRWTLTYLALISIGYAGVLAYQEVAAWPALTVIMAGELIAVVFIAHLLISRLRSAALKDELTGLDNRRAWASRLTEELARARRDRLPLSIVLLDLDAFKAVNDQYGHDAGDRLLIAVARVWQGVLRPGDVLARWGGDEFGLILTNCKAECAEEIIHRLAEVMPKGHTVSTGVATWDGFEDEEALMRRADEGVYASKQERLRRKHGF